MRLKEEYVFAKTLLGQEVISTRSIQLEAKSRTLLIAIDGKKIVGQLQKIYGALLGDLPSLLKELTELALIERLATEESEDTIDFEGRSLTQAQFEQTKHYLSEFVRSALGKDGNKLGEFVLQAEGVDDLSAVIEACHDIVLQIAGKRKAHAFVDELKQAILVDL